MSFGFYVFYLVGQYVVQKMVSQRCYFIFIFEFFVGYYISVYDACVSKVFGKDGGQAGQGFFIVCRVGLQKLLVRSGGFKVGFKGQFGFKLVFGDFGFSIY